MVAVALFEVLPEAIELLPEDPSTVAALVGAGFLAFFLFERVLVLHHRDEPSDARAHGQVGAMGALGLSAHSFVDGLAVGLAFGVDAAAGVLVLVAVLSHDFADGLNTVSFVLSQSQDRRAAIRWLAIDAVAPLLGATVGALISVSEATLGPHPRLLRRLLPLHGRDRPAARGARARLVGAGRPDGARVRGDLRRLAADGLTPRPAAAPAGPPGRMAYPLPSARRSRSSRRCSISARADATSTISTGTR